jgi:exodeoxyribonuclease VII small subunit
MVTDATSPSDATIASDAAPPIPPDVADLTFEAAMAEFQATVAALEAGGQPLEEALALFERGVLLQRHLDRLLSDAELRFRRLVERGGGRLDVVDLPEGGTQDG